MVDMCLHVSDSHMLFILVMQLSPVGGIETFFTRGSQTGPVPNNTHSHLHNPSIPKGRRGRERQTDRQTEGERTMEMRGGNGEKETELEMKDTEN